VLLAAIGAGAAALDARPLTLRGIRLYQRTLAPIAGRAGARCRFTPSCSRYAEIVVARDGAIVGGWEALKRVARCGPWTKPGTVDLP
jgi:putative membrane protein insertion efficiency factor